MVVSMVHRRASVLVMWLVPSASSVVVVDVVLLRMLLGCLNTTIPGACQHRRTSRL